MFLHRLFTRIIDPDDHAAGLRLLRGLLRLPARLFGLASGLRSRGYTYGWLRQEQLPIRVISIGGLTVGGAGKTPVTRYIVARLSAGRRVVILSRGYGRSGSQTAVVSDGHGHRLPWKDAGDEPFLLAAALPDTPVVVGADRIAAGRLAIRSFSPDAILLDDGFQHRRLARDLDIVVLDGAHPDGNGCYLPAGPLREPLTALRRAGLIVLTRVDQSADIGAVRKRIRHINADAPIVESIYTPARLHRLSDGTTLPLEEIKGCRVIILSGIANPRSFERTVEQIGAFVIHTFRYRDHHPFSISEIHAAHAALSDAQAVWIVTTEKDAVRIPEESDRSRILALEIDLEIVQGEAFLENMVWVFK